MSGLNTEAFARRLESVLIAPEATRSDVAGACAEASRIGLAAVCIQSSRVAQAVALLEDTATKVVALVGFPWGAADADVKRYETEVALDHGAQEIEFFLNTGRLKDGEARYLLREMRDSPVSVPRISSGVPCSRSDTVLKAFASCLVLIRVVVSDRSLKASTTS